MSLGYLEDPVDTIDAAIFTGESFNNWEAIAELEYYMARWQRELDRIKATMYKDLEMDGEDPK